MCILVFVSDDIANALMVTMIFNRVVVCIARL